MIEKKMKIEFQNVNFSRENLISIPSSKSLAQLLRGRWHFCPPLSAQPRNARSCRGGSPGILVG